jgi:1-acyl-sn-glycerol-3-phosphate acyltransferase
MAINLLRKKKNVPKKDVIPHPELSSWMFTRYHLPSYLDLNPKAVEESERRYRWLNYILSTLVKVSVLSKWRYAGFRFLTSFGLLLFKIFNRVEITGRENIPKQGAIFYANHPGSLDPILLICSLRHPVGCFVSYDNYWLTSFGVKYSGFINKEIILENSIKSEDFHSSNRNYERDLLTEVMIRNILFVNRYFAIWPEGTLSRQGLISRGFSSVVRAYATINSKKDLIPFVPVLFEGSQCYHIGYNHNLSPRTNKIKVKFQDPYFIPRDWLLNPEIDKKGKTPREIIDYMMNILVQAHGQNRFAKNHRLMHVKKEYQNKKS